MDELKSEKPATNAPQESKRTFNSKKKRKSEKKTETTAPEPMNINNLQDALSRWNGYKIRYHAQEREMKVLREEYDQLKSQLHSSKQKLAMEMTDADIADRAKYYANEKFAELKREYKQLQQAPTTTETEHDSKSQFSPGNVGKVSEERGRLWKQIEILQRRLDAKVKESRQAEKEAATWRIAELAKRGDDMEKVAIEFQGYFTLQATNILKLEAEKNDANGRVLNLEEEVKALKNTLRHRQAQFEAEVKSKDALSSRLNQVSKRAKEIEKALQVSKEQTAILEAEVRSKDALSNMLNQVSTQAIEIGKELKVSKEQTMILEQKCLIIELQRQEAISDGKRVWELSNELEKQLNIKTDEADKAIGALQAANNRVKKLEQEISILRERTITGGNSKTKKVNQINVKLENALKMVQERNKQISTLNNALAAERKAKKNQTARLEQASKEIKDLKEQIASHRREGSQRAAEKVQALIQTAKFEAKSRRHSLQATKREQECLDHKKSIHCVERRGQESVCLSGQIHAAKEQVEGILRRITELEEEARAKSLTERTTFDTSMQNPAMVKVQISPHAAKGLAAFQDTVNNDLSRNMKTVSLTCNVLKINLEGKTDLGVCVATALPMLWHAVSELERDVQEVVSRLAYLTGGKTGQLLKVFPFLKETDE